MKPKMFIVTTIPLSLMFFKGQIGELKHIFDVSLVSSPGARLETAKVEEGVVVHAVPMQREIALVKDLKSLMTLIFLFRKEKPFVVHGNTPKGGLLSMIAAYICRVPNRVYYLHGLRYEGVIGAKRKLLIMMERISCKCATRVYSVSQGVRDTLMKDHITKKEIRVIHNGSVNGINTAHFDPNTVLTDDLKKEYHITESDTVFGFVGRLAGDKGINELVEAFENILKQNKNCKLLLVGMFEEDLDPLQPKTITAIKNNSNIIHAGFQKDIRPFLAIMDIFVFPSYREGFGVSIMEAQAMGVPVISSDITGCNEIIKEGYNGLLIPPRSLPRLQQAMEQLCDDPKLIQQMKTVARKTMKAKYDQQYVWKETVASYKTMIPNV